MNVLLIVGVLVLIWLIVLFLCWIGRRFQQSDFVIPVRDVSKGHHWLYVEAFEAGHYCSVCEINTFHGGQCDFCGIIADDGCIKKADSMIPCKCLSREGPMVHHWVKGNLPQGSHCTVCEEPCGDGVGLRDATCCWCQIRLHSACLQSYSSICDLGKFKKMIVPPKCVKLRAVGWKGRKHLIVQQVLKPALDGWSPVLVICNRESGNGEGGLVLEAFRRLLNPAQVLDLAEIPPESGLEWCHLLSDVRCRILVAGGDGTVGWVLSTMEKLRMTDPPPEVCLLPLGTGNDLSRVLGWGPGHAGPIHAEKILQSLAQALPVHLDRWTVTVKQRREGKFGIKRKSAAKILTMSNYMSVGVDALVTLNFHNRRHTLPRVMSGRITNKLLFFSYGTKDVLEHACKDLNSQVDLYMDGKLIELPELEGIVILNIQSWGAGVRPWDLFWEPGMGQQRIDDGLLEVFGLYSSLHIAQLQVGLSEPHRLGQAKEVVLKLKTLDGKSPTLPMQVDGEPWLQKSATVTVTWKGQACMLANGNARNFSPLTGSPISEYDSEKGVFFA